MLEGLRHEDLSRWARHDESPHDLQWTFINESRIA